MADPVQATEAIPEQPSTETQAAPVETGADGQPFDSARAQALIEKLRAENKAAKAAEKELEQLRAEAKKRADAELSEAERLKKQADEATAENAKLKADILRRDVIAETGLPAIFADRLKGATKEEMLADAQELARTLPTLKIPPKLPTTNPSNAETSETDVQKRARLFGTPRNIFDPDEIKAKGGGVFFPK